MKKTNLSIALAGLMIASAAIVSSCKKKEATTTPTPDTNASTASDNNTVEQQSNDAENIGAQANENGSLSTFRLAGGGSNILGANDTVVKTTSGSTDIYTVTFNNFLGSDGHTRNGVISYSVTPSGAYYRTPGMVMSVATPGNTYMVDGNTVEITKTIKNTTSGAPSGSNNEAWSITSNVTLIKASGGGTIIWSATRTHTLLNTGAYTLGGNAYPAAFTSLAVPITWSEAIVEINGSSSGTSADGLSFTASSTNVIRNMGCAPISGRPHFHPFCSGTVTFTPAGKTARILNFGTGNCITTYTVSIGSWSETLNW